MIIQDSLKKFGDYVLLMRRVFTIPDRWREFFQKIYFRNIQLGIDYYSHRHYYFRFHRSRDCHTNAKECGIAHDTGLRRRIGYPRCHLIGIFLFHTMSDLGR